MSKLKINKKFLAWILALNLTVGGAGFLLKNGNRTTSSENSLKNRIGYTNINPFFNFKVSEDDFVILDMGDHDSVRTRFEKQKAKFCNENDITLGIIISSDSETESEIYDDVEYTKSLIKKYDIDFPIYLDINNIMTNDNLNNEMKKKLIKDFLEKCSANNIYVGLYGTDTNLCRVKEHCGITEYDAYLVMDSAKVKYDGSYTICKDLDGNIIAKADLSIFVTGKALNQSNRFVNDGTHRMALKEDITDVALKYGLSVNDLLAFSNMKREDVVAGTEIRIPSVVENYVGDGLKITFQSLESPIRGCDLSYAQGTDIDWEQIRENFEFIIIRCSQGLSEDASFESNALNASRNDIPLGVYCFNDFDMENCEDLDDFTRKQEAQANLTLDLLRNKNIVYPVYLDIEGSNINETLDKDAVNTMLEIWQSKMTSAGYIPGLYCNQSGFDYLQSQVDYDLSEKMQIWIAGGEQFTGETKDIPLEEVVPSAKVKEKYPSATIIQSTDSATGSGAENSDGHLDVNFSYCDYTKKKVTGTTPEKYPTKEFVREDPVLIVTGLTGGCIVALGLGITSTRNNKKKSKAKAKYLKKDA